MGNISVYFVSYYRYVLNYASLDANSFLLLQPLIIAFATPVFPLGNAMVDWFGNRSRPVLALGGALAISLVLSCSIMRMPPWIFILCYALGMGIFKGLLQSALLRAGWSHLPARKGMVSGLVLSGYGCGGFIFGLYSSYLANPDDIKYKVDPQDGERYLPLAVGERVPFMLQILCLTWALQILFGLATITNYSSPKQSSIDDSSQN